MNHRTKINITLAQATSATLSRASALTGETPEELVEAALARFLDAFEEDETDITHDDELREPAPVQEEEVVSERVLLAGLEAEKIHRRVHERAREEGLARELLRDLVHDKKQQEEER